MTKVLVTGANGFIGSYIVKRLIKERYKVYGMVRKTSNLCLINGLDLKLVYADLRDKESVVKATAGKDIIIHNAALARDWARYEDFYSTNVVGTANIFEAAVINNVRRMVYISSISVYGIYDHVNSNEDTIKYNCNFDYCTTKREAEKVADRYLWEGKVKTTILQPGVVFGPDDWVTTHQIIDAVSARSIGYVRGGKKSFSPIYIDNLIDAIILVLKNRKSVGRTYIVTDGLRITWREFIEAIAAYLDVKPPTLSVNYWFSYLLASLFELVYKRFGIKKSPILTKYRVSIVSHDLFFSNEKIRNELGFKPGIGIRAGIKNSIKWYQSLKNKES